MDETVTPDVAAWLYNLVARQVIEVGHPDAREQATMAWRALDQLATIIERDTHGTA